MRGTPLLVQLFIIYYALPSAGFSFDPLTAATIGLSLNSGAYQAEYLRGAIQSIPSGQMIAARTLGMTQLKAIKNIILPQSLRISIPAWSNELIYLIKYTSIVYIIQVRELFAEGIFIASDTYRYIEVYAILAIIYLFFTFIFTEVIDYIERKVSIPGIGTIKGSELRHI